jgi:hypothetical protein
MAFLTSMLSMLLASQAVYAKTLVRDVRVSVSAAGDSHVLEQPTMHAGIQNIVNEVEEMVRSGATPEPEKIRTIRSIVADELLPDLTATRDAAAKQVGLNLEAVDQCNQNSVKRLGEIQNGAEQSTGQHRTEHSDCRKAEQTLVDNKKEKCDALDSYLGTINDPSNQPAGRERAAMVDYVKKMSSYYCPKGPEVTTKDKDCTNATDALATKKGECDNDQANFENAFCTWRTELSDQCTAYSTCYTDKSKIFNDFVDETKTQVEKWKVEYASLKKIECYLDVWLSDDTTTKTNTLSSCDSKNIDTSPMNVDFPALPAQAKCDLSAVEDHPGTSGFRTKEYAEFDALASKAINCLTLSTQ